KHHQCGHIVRTFLQNLLEFCNRVWGFSLLRVDLGEDGIRAKHIWIAVYCGIELAAGIRVSGIASQVSSIERAKKCIAALLLNLSMQSIKCSCWSLRLPKNKR